MSTLQYTLIPVTAFAQNCSLLICTDTRQSAIVDPGGDAEKIKQAVVESGCTPQQILLTHGHLDHVGAASELATFYNIPMIGPHIADKFWLDALPVQSEMFGFGRCEPFLPDRWLTEGEVVSLGKLRLEVLHCPGHTPGHIVFFERDNQTLISGDVIFRGGVGRSDFPQGDHQQLINSITQKLLPLGDDVRFIAGHGPQSTLGEEKACNPFLQ